MQLALPAQSEIRATRRRLLQRGWQAAVFASGDNGSAAKEPAGSEAADVDVFEAFFHRYERDIVDYLWHMTGDEQSARDLAQETFLRAWQQFERIYAYDQPRAWLLRVATHLALNHLRLRRITNRLFAPLHPDVLAASHDYSTQVVQRDAIGVTLRALSPRERGALLLHEIFGLSCAELAETLGISLSATKVTLWRAREHFRTAYTREEISDAADAN